MKSMTTNMMMAAAALVVATGVASAQQYRADIPFAFNAGGKMLAAGTYMLKVDSGTQWLLQITNRESQKSSLALPTARTDGRYNQPAGGAPTLTFVCGSSRCSLAQMWTGPERPALTFSQPRTGKDERASATVRVVKMNGD
jgi:hypothetical protein